MVVVGGGGGLGPGVFGSGCTIYILIRFLAIKILEASVSYKPLSNWWEDLFGPSFNPF